MRANRCFVLWECILANSWCAWCINFIPSTQKRYDSCQTPFSVYTAQLLRSVVALMEIEQKLKVMDDDSTVSQFY